MDFQRQHPRASRALLVGGALVAAGALGTLAWRAFARKSRATTESTSAAAADSGDSKASKGRRSFGPQSAALLAGITKVIIGTRSSQLALWQAHHVQALLSEKYPSITFEVLPMSTMGDKDQIKPLSDFESKGVFTKELDVATNNDTIQMAVHCLKDLPTTLPDGLYMGAVLPRGDTEDVLVLPASHPKHSSGTLEDLPPGAVIGTSAMRRSATIAKYYPHLKCENIRGNVNTRLMKLDRSAAAEHTQHTQHDADYGHACGRSFRVARRRC